MKEGTVTKQPDSDVIELQLSDDGHPRRVYMLRENIDAKLIDGNAYVSLDDIYMVSRHLTECLHWQEDKNPDLDSWTAGAAISAGIFDQIHDEIYARLF